MAVITNITKQYAKAVFLDHTRTFDSVPATQKDGVKQYAAATYYVEDIGDALTAGTVTQAQHDEVLALNPNMPHRPVIAASDPAPVV